MTNMILLTEDDINTQEAASGSKNINIVMPNLIINIDKSGIDELILDLINHKSKFGNNW